MAQLEGIMKFTGAIGDVVSYELNGKWIIRRKSSVSKERIKNHPNYQRTRELNQEFGGASTIGKQLRTFWHPIIQRSKDATLHHRLNSFLLSIIQQGEGECGQRSFVWNNALSAFHPFVINKSTSPSSYLSNIPKASATGNQIIVHFNDIQLIRAPQGTTHFKVAAQLNVLHDYHYHTDQGKYVPTSTDQEAHRFESNILSLQETYTQAHTFVPQHSGNWAFAVYLIFYQEVNAQFVELSECPFSWEGIV